MSWIALLALVAAGAADAGGSSAEIVNSGSTNTRGYVIEVRRSGALVVDAEDGAGPRDMAVAPDLVARFFATLDAAKPLGSLPLGNCPKSKSFGYSIAIRYRGTTSPDLTCPVGAEEQELASLAAEIARRAQLSDRTRRRPRDP